MIRTLLRLALAATLLFTGFCAFLTISGWGHFKGNADVGIILGSKVHPDGRPSRSLRERLDHGLRLYEEERVQWLIVSGALGHEGHDEAVIMRDYLVKKGVPAGRILVDSEGWDTRQTAENTSRIMKMRGWDDAVAVSQYYHIPRCRLALQQEGIPTASGSAPFVILYPDFWGIPREALAFCAYLVRLK